MSGILSRSPDMHAKKQENTSQMRRKSPSIETDWETTHDQLVEKEIKTTVLNMFLMLKKIEEGMSRLRRNMEDIKKDWYQTSADKNAILVRGKALSGINRIFDTGRKDSWA